MGALAELVGALEATAEIPVSNGKKLEVRYPTFDESKAIRQKLKSKTENLGEDNFDEAVVEICTVVLKELCPAFAEESEPDLRRDVMNSLRQKDRLAIMNWWTEVSQGVGLTEMMQGNFKTSAQTQK